MTEIVIVRDMEELSERAAERFSRLASEAVAARGRFSVALSGGGTPRGMYQRLAEEPYRSQIPWRHIYLFWGDERAVPRTDPESNYGQAYQAFIKRVPIPTGNVRPIRGDLAPEAAAQVYATELEAFFGGLWPEFDLVLLGMGEDGHVAALFPGSPVLDEIDRPVAASTGSYQGRPAQRVTLTLPAINNARQVMVLAGGAAKAEMVKRVLDGSRGELPAQRVRPASGQVVWILDRGAAGGLEIKK